MDKKELKLLRKYQLLSFNIPLIVIMISFSIGFLTGTIRFIIALYGVFALVLGFFRMKFPNYVLFPKLKVLKEYEKLKLGKDALIESKGNPTLLGVILIVQAFFSRSLNLSLPIESLPLVFLIAIIILILINLPQIYYNTAFENSTKKELKGLTKRYKRIFFVSAYAIVLIIVVAYIAYNI